MASAKSTGALNDLGKSLIIVNPVAQSGTGSRNGRIAFNKLRDVYRQNVELIYTRAENDAKHIATKCSKFDSVIAIGGDGVIHEVVNGLMQIPKRIRPKFGAIPVGSGNDFARTLGMSFKAENAVDQLMIADVQMCDIGQVNSDFFTETLSFGLDAGIALGTVDLRKETNEKGLKLYFKSGVNEIKNNFHHYEFKLELDEEKYEDECVIIAFQNGPTYGGGFKICPKARATDGKISICMAAGKIPVGKALFMFGCATKGHHVHFKEIKLREAECAKLEFTGKFKPRCQIDGEEYIADTFNIKMLHKELSVYAPNKL